MSLGSFLTTWLAVSVLLGPVIGTFLSGPDAQPAQVR